MKLRDIEGLKIDDEDMEKFGRFKWYKIVNKRRKAISRSFCPDQLPVKTLFKRS